MARISYLDRRRAGPREPADALERRNLRLTRRVRAAAEPIVWLRAGAGSGKSRLLQALKTADPAVIVLDDPASAALTEALTALSTARVQRVVIASRPESDIASLLLREQMYGRVAVFGEMELFVAAEDATGGGEAALLSDTGGWPMLVAASLESRASEACGLLPRFLERDILPCLPEAVVVALFAALSAPLTDPELRALCSGEVPVHPLLRKQADHWQVSGSWVREALKSLRTSTVTSPAARERLRHHYSHLHAPDRAIAELLAMGATAEALELFKQAGGVFFGYRHGYHTLENVLRLFGPELEQRAEELFLARLCFLIKSGRPREALMRLEARHPGLPVDLRRMRLTHRAEAMLLRIDMSLDIDEPPPPEVIASWGRLQHFLPEGNEIARGILLNCMAIGFLQADALVEAQRLAEESLAAYRSAGSPYLVHCMQLHLCDIALRRSRIKDAARLVEQAHTSLEASGQAFNSEREILLAVKSRVAFEEGRFQDCPAEIEPILKALLEGDSWPDLIERLSVHSVLTGYWLRGLRHALERFDQCALTLDRRHGSAIRRRLSLLRILLMQVAQHHAEADMLLEEYELEPAAHRSLALEVEEGLIRLRQAVVQERSRATIGRLTDSLSRHPALEPRQRITIAILNAAALARHGGGSASRRYLRVALREAEAENLVAVLLEDGEFVARLLPEFIAAPGPGNARLAQFAGRVLRLLKSLPTAPLNSKALAGVSRQEHRVLSYVADGYKNKQIGRALGLSESTVKFHLRSLFRKLKVGSRAALADAARSRGIST
ncbi:MAG TPA: LuxR C-terminal-related transcriptional regulator [Steroidobacteraceae bacterium]|nr:LuxR C-terminal-related transcriptional regulator [Steroidobacteraceae bacterium]